MPLDRVDLPPRRAVAVCIKCRTRGVHSQRASLLSQRLPANVHLAANVSALGFTVSECLQIFACILQLHLEHASICCLAVAAASGRRERVIMAMRAIIGSRAGDLVVGMLTASRPEARAPPHTEEFRQLYA